MDDDLFEAVDELQGASRTTGGFCRGKAVGNAPAFADLEIDSVGFALQIKGRVFLHAGDPVPYSMSQPVGSKLGSVLNDLAKLYSPIKHRNAHISVQEDGVWALKGRYTNAVQVMENLPWTQDDQGKWSVTLQAEGVS